MGYLADFFSLYDELKSLGILRLFSAHGVQAQAPGRFPERIERSDFALLDWKSKTGGPRLADSSRGMKAAHGDRPGHQSMIRRFSCSMSLLRDSIRRARVELKDLLRPIAWGPEKTIFITSHILSDLGRNLHLDRHYREGAAVASGPLGRGHGRRQDLYAGSAFRLGRHKVLRLTHGLRSAPAVSGAVETRSRSAIRL